MADAVAPEDPTVRKLAVSIPAMCEMLDIGLSTGWDLVSAPDPDEDSNGKPAIETITIGRRRLALVASIHEYVDRKRSKPHRRVASPPVGRGRRPRREAVIAAN